MHAHLTIANYTTLYIGFSTLAGYTTRTRVRVLSALETEFDLVIVDGRSGVNITSEMSCINEPVLESRTQDKHC